MAAKIIVKKRRGNPLGRRGRASPGPTPIAIHVGQRFRERRTVLGMSQHDVGRLLGVTFQQVQKNERGANRFSASRLFEAARVLDVPVGYFFEDMPAEVSSHGRKHMQGVAEGPPPTFDLDPMAKRETLELVRAYYDLTDDQVRHNMVTMMRTLARNDPGSRVHNRPRRGRPPKNG
ncbi:MAG: helix-turn-helix domain-containing protein [Tagaea sp.]